MRRDTILQHPQGPVENGASGPTPLAQRDQDASLATWQLAAAVMEYHPE